MIEGHYYVFGNTDEKRESLASGCEGFHSNRLNSFAGKPEKADLVTTRHFNSSDQGEDAVNISNYRAFMRMMTEDSRLYRELCGKLFWPIYGHNGYQDIAFLPDADERSEEIREVLEGLEDYPLLDEDEHSAVEQEQADGAWDYFGRHDFKKFLGGAEGYSLLVVGLARSFFVERYPELEPVLQQLPDEDVLEMFAAAGALSTPERWGGEVDLLDDPTLDHIWNALLREGSGDEVQHAGGGDVRFNFERALRGWTLTDLVGLAAAFNPNSLHSAVMWQAEVNSALLGDGKLNLSPDEMRVLFDAIHEEGGWTERAAKLLRQFRSSAVKGFSGYKTNRRKVARRRSA